MFVTCGFLLFDGSTAAGLGFVLMIAVTCDPNHTVRNNQHHEKRLHALLVHVLLADRPISSQCAVFSVVCLCVAVSYG